MSACAWAWFDSFIGLWTGGVMSGGRWGGTDECVVGVFVIVIVSGVGWIFASGSVAGWVRLCNVV